MGLSNIEDILQAGLDGTDIPEPESRIAELLKEWIDEGGKIEDILVAGSNITLTKNDDGTITIAASGEVSSEDTVARGAIQAILDGTTLDSFGDVETALSGKQDTINDLSDIRTGAGKGATAVQPESGKGLSENDFTNALKTKLDNIAAGAEVNVQADWEQTTDTADDYIKNKPTIPAAQVNSDWDASSGVSQILNKPTLGTAAAAATTDFATSAQGTKADSAVQSVKVNGSALTPDTNKAVDITAIPASVVSAGALASGMTATTQSTSDDSTKLATTAFVHDVVDNLPEPMIFKSGMTLTADTTDTTKCAITVTDPASASNIKGGYTYKVTNISGTYTGTIKVGDTLIAKKDAPKIDKTWVVDTDWTVVPSGDETGYVVGKSSGTTQGHAVVWGSDGYSIEDGGSVYPKFTFDNGYIAIDYGS